MTLGRLSERLSRTDLLQLSALFFAILLFSFIVTWPTSLANSNDTWFALSQSRILCLSLLAVGYGSASSDQVKGEQRLTLAALLCLALLSTPLEIASYALSYPPQPLYYSLGLGLVDTLALFGIGLLLGYLLKLLRLRALLPLAVPGVLVGLVMADLSLGWALVNPLSALGTASPYHLAFMAVPALLTVFYLLTKEPG